MFGLFVSLHRASTVIRSRHGGRIRPPGEHHRAVTVAPAGDRGLQMAVTKDCWQLMATAGRPGSPQALVYAIRVIGQWNSQPIVRFDVACQVAKCAIVPACRVIR